MYKIFAIMTNRHVLLRDTINLSNTIVKNEQLFVRLLNKIKHVDVENLLLNRVKISMLIRQCNAYAYSTLFKSHIITPSKGV